MTHAKLRAIERYNICDLDEGKLLYSIKNNDCVEIKLNKTKKGRRGFVVLYDNKYVVVITEKKIRAVCTVLPYDDKYFDAVCELVAKKQQSLSKRNKKFKNRWNIFSFEFWSNLFKFIKLKKAYK